MKKNLLFEIGTEELPARFIEPALESIRNFLEKTLKELELAYEDIKTGGTARRLAVSVLNLEEKQKDREEEILGPSVSVALDEAGNFTPALLGFARKHGVNTDALYIKDTPKGRYFCFKKTIEGKRTEELLPALLIDLLKNVYFPKKMRWADFEFPFARPIRWLLALYGQEVISLEINGIKSDRFSYGHRFLSARPIEFKEACWETYKRVLEENFVLVDIEDRLRRTKEEIEKVAHPIGKVELRSELLTENAHLIEYPFPTLGTFPEKFLKMPSKLVVTALQEHQRYFVIYNETQQLLPYFIAVNNNRPKDVSILVRGHERVAKARLEDALFYYERDLKTPLSAKIEKLKGIVYHIRCGTLYDKTLRLIELGKFLSKKLFPTLSLELVEEACRYSKADLASEVVKEFPSLQGFMGAHYLQIEGKREISPALYEQYLPNPQDERFPETEIGTILSLADKLDHLCAMFGVGERATGEGDPFGLRRAGLGILKILIEKKLLLNLEEVLPYAVALLEKQGFLRESSPEEEIIDFLRKRLEGEFLNLGFPKNFIYAVIEKPLNPYDLYLRISAIKALSVSEDFKDLLIVFKRVTQILKNVDTSQLGDIKPELFQSEEEHLLWRTLLEQEKELLTLFEERRYVSYLERLLFFKEPIHRFFEKVFVMVEDVNLKNNRLALLNKLANNFLKFGDLAYVF